MNDANRNAPRLEASLIGIYEIAELARVSTSTLTSWLLRFGFRIRSVSEQLGRIAHQRRDEGG